MKQLIFMNYTIKGYIFYMLKTCIQTNIANIDLAFHLFLFTTIYVENICEVIFICKVQTKVFSTRCVNFTEWNSN